VSEPELVEHATYLIKATERRYMFLVRLKRSEAGEGSPLCGSLPGGADALRDEAKA